MTSAGGTPRPESAAPRPIAPAVVSPHEHVPEFAELVNEHLDFVWRLLRRLGLSPADADDAAQHVFMLADSKRSQFSPDKARTFLYGMAWRVAANARRARDRRREVPESVLAPVASDQPLPDHLLELDRARLFLDELLSELPEELRRVLLLAEMEGQTVAAIAELEGIPAGTAGSRLRRARAQFRKLLAREQHRNPFSGVVP